MRGDHDAGVRGRDGLRAGLNPILKIDHLQATRPPGVPAPAVNRRFTSTPRSRGRTRTSIEGHAVANRLPAIRHALKLLAAADNLSSGLRRFLLLHSDLHGGGLLPPIGRLLRAQDTVYATVVESIEWDGPPFPGSKITDHTVRVPGFGKIVFGELLLTALSRRLTLLRLELGSPEGGDVAAAEVESNGIWT